MELITRRCIRELEGLGTEAGANPDDIGEEVEIPADILREYADASTERHKNMVELIRQKLNFTSLKFNRLDDMIAATGIDRDKLCTYCWDGRE
jgi:amidophosphoribosyltransferase